MISSIAQRLVVAFVTGASILTAPTFVWTKPIRCLPPPSCKTPQQCCHFQHDGLLRFAMADARKMRDWFGDQCNADSYKTSAALDKGADDAENATTQAMAVATKMTPADVDMHNGQINDNGAAATTDPYTCKTTYPPGFDSQNTCQEILDGIKAHESEHQDFCGAMKSSTAMQRQYGSVGSVNAEAEDERRGHAVEYLRLVSQYEAARRRCLSTMGKLTPELEKDSKKTVQRAKKSYLKGGGCN